MTQTTDNEHSGATACYAKLLRDPRWQKLRLEVMERDQWSCTHCDDSASTLNVHHRNGYRNGAMPWEYPLEDLQTLCEDCHGKLKGLRHGAVQLHEGGGFDVSGGCPKCGGRKWKDKGSYDKCLECGFSTDVLYA